MKILIVEDDRDNAESMANALHLLRARELTVPGLTTPAESDLRIRIAHSRKAALEVVSKPPGFRPDVLLVDIHLNGDPRGGADVIKDLVASGIRRQLGVVVLSGYKLSDPHDLPPWAAFLSKPAEPCVILAALEAQEERSDPDLQIPNGGKT